MATCSKLYMTKMVIGFNRHFYYVAIALGVSAIIALQFIENKMIRMPIVLGIGLATYFVLTSVVACFFIYDNSDLYKMRFWTERCIPSQRDCAVLVHAGFDPTSELLKKKYPEMNLSVLNFFNEEKLSEKSIKKAYEHSAILLAQKCVQPDAWGCEAYSKDLIFILSAAHELRQHQDRCAFFNEAKRILKPGGTIVVMEQLRNLPNFFVFGLAAFHFFSRKTWIDTFSHCALRVDDEFNVTLFMRVFVLRG